MNWLSDKWYRRLQTIASIILLTFVTCFICFMTAGSMMIELLNAGVNKYLSFTVGLLTAVGCYLFIIFNHHLRDLVNLNKELDK